MSDRTDELARHVEELIFDGDTDCGTRLRWALDRAHEEGRRAALRERDAEWRKALDQRQRHRPKGAKAYVCSDSQCSVCAPLRALLEEAGK